MLMSLCALFFLTSGVNLKVPVRASGSDRIDVLPQKGTVFPQHERQHPVKVEIIDCCSSLCRRPSRRGGGQSETGAASALTLWVLLQGVVEAPERPHGAGVQPALCHAVFEKQGDQHVWRLHGAAVVRVPHHFRSG